jgi:hypothetical protein
MISVLHDWRLFWVRFIGSATCWDSLWFQIKSQRYIISLIFIIELGVGPASVNVTFLYIR